MRLRLRLASRPENVAVVRAALSGLAGAAGLSRERTIDLKTAVSEACNNVCLHAYPEDEFGPMLVEADLRPDGLEVAVIDHGSGITHVSNRRGRMGLGLALINALSDATEFRRAAGGGADVRMRFAWPLDRVVAACADGAGDPLGGATPGATAADDLQAPLDFAGEVVLWCQPSRLQRPVLLRLLTYLAATAHFSVDSLAYLSRVNAGIAHEVDVAGDGWIGASIDAEPRHLHLTIAPLLADREAGAASGLTDEVAALERERLDGRVALHFTIADRQG
ncbi:MAG TPA: ATP-binding protein [Solirubrobacteraceae bacterium]|nr:ATP-binding protein [Solirubrobacteraceae bacterium]